MTVEDLPEFLHFAEDGLNGLLESIHYKNLQYSKSPQGDSAFYRADIVSKEIGINLPFGLRLVLNPDEDGDSTISSFPVSVQYEWGILAFLKSFDISNFSFEPEGFFELGLKIFRISSEQMIGKMFNFFVDPVNDSTTKFQQLINDINTAYPDAHLSLPTNQVPTLNSITNLISESTDVPKTLSSLMFELYLLDIDLAVSRKKLQLFFDLIVPNGIEDYIRRLVTPKAKATLTLSAGIEFPTSVLQPVNLDGSIIPNTKTIFKFGEATFYVDTEAGIGTQLEFDGSLIPNYSRIGNTGFIIEIKKAKLDLSRTTNIPEADAAGYPADFTGLYVQEALIKFDGFGDEDTSRGQSVSLKGENMLIGSGGFSGKVTLQSEGVLYRNFDSFAVELDVFSVTFHQNAIVDCSISGKLTLDRFTQNGTPAVIDIQVHINDNGDFSITALPSPNLITFTLPQVFDFHVRAMSIGKTQRGYYFNVAGQLDFIADIPVLGKVLPKGIEIKKLLIWSDGGLEFEGGGLVVPKSFRLSIGPVKLEVSHLALGAYNRQHNGIDRDYRYFGFDGMVNAGSAGFSAAGNGIKYYFTIDGKEFDHFLSIDGIAIDITIPGSATKDTAAFILHGFLGMHNPDPGAAGSKAGEEYSGSVSVTMPKLGLSGSAGMRLKPSVPSFLVDMGLELSIPIPLASTGLGIYGFRGLFGKHYLPSKTAAGLTEAASWWDYYKVPSKVTNHEGIEIDKFADEDGYSIGAGLSIATAFDSGLIFSSKLFLLLGLSDVFLIQGQAGILRSRIGLNDPNDPPFSALIAIDGHSFTAKFGVDYRIPDGGQILDIHGDLDMAFFFNNASGWYINAGKDQPEKDRIQAKILTLFQGYAYLMLSSQGVKAGAGAKFDFQRKFGPAKVGIGANLDLSGFLSFKPIQIGGRIEFGGYAYLKVFCVKLGLSVRVYLAVEAPHPFNISGGLEVKVHIIFKTIKVKIDISWHIDSHSNLQDPIPVLDLPDPSKGYLPAVATNILSNETFQLNYVTLENSDTIPAPGSSLWAFNFNNAGQAAQVTIPLDSFVDINLLKPVIPQDNFINPLQPAVPASSFLGGAFNQLPDGYTEVLPPQKGVGDQAKHQYELSGLEIKAWSGTQWVDYNVYEAVTAIVNSNTGTNAVDLSKLKPGFWQYSEPNKYNKIRLLSQNMFSFLTSTDTTSSDLDGRYFPKNAIFCYDDIESDVVVNWKEETSGTSFTSAEPFYKQGLIFNLLVIDGSVASDTYYGDKSLRLNGQWGALEVSFPEPVASVTLKLGTNQNNVSVDFTRRSFTRGIFGIAFPANVSKKQVWINRKQENLAIEYKNTDQPIDRIYIRLNLSGRMDYTGDLVIGGHFRLPDDFSSATSSAVDHDMEGSKALMLVSIYNRSFTTAEVLSRANQDTQNVAGRWAMDSYMDSTGHPACIINGEPGMVPGFYEDNGLGQAVLHKVYSFDEKYDAAIVPYQDVLNVESGSFSIEATVRFDPFITGVSTLLYKVNEDEGTGLKKGFALHLVQNTAAILGTVYNNDADIPGYSLWFTCYNESETWGIEVTDRYTLDCPTATIDAVQYRNIFITADRSSGKLNIYIDRVLSKTVDLPAELAVFSDADTFTDVNEITYKTHSLQRRWDDNPITATHVVDEVKILGDGLNRTIQPVWRPDTLFAVKVKTRDRINDRKDGVPEQTHIFGFKTAGPVGHFHQQNPQYQALAAQDRAAEFKLANLKQYIDYERSFPDAQGRYNLSKPVFCENPQVKLFFTAPYVNAMYSNWAAYQGMAAVNSSLDLSLIDPSGTELTPTLLWDPIKQSVIDGSNLDSLPEDQRILYMFYLAAARDSCYRDVSPDNPAFQMTRNLQQGHFQFPNLAPRQLYNAVFRATYQPTGEDQTKVEVHKFGFITSRYMNFTEQASSFILDQTAMPKVYAAYPKGVILSDDVINNRIIKLIDDQDNNDPDDVLRYATKFDRLIFGGLDVKDWEQIDHSVITVFVNTNPATGVKSILGILIRNPEPFNDPKLPALQLQDTVTLSLRNAAGAVVDTGQMVYIHSADTSAVFMTNTMLKLPAVNMMLRFKQKIFDGNNYVESPEYFDGEWIDLLPFLT
ncbi:MAG: hypothetical protein JWQ57_4335 [Mucilaginibacter sp.]|nr:hypothetical protein [Mucilaginibacter sp.]